jgi:ABC-type transport system substrate-binding protein
LIATQLTLRYVGLVIFTFLILTIALAIFFNNMVRSRLPVVSTLFPVVLICLAPVEKAKADDLTVLVPNLPKEIDPRNIADTASALIANQIYQKLYRFDENNFLNPELAESVRWSDDLKTLDLTIKKVPGSQMANP